MTEEVGRVFNQLVVQAQAQVANANLIGHLIEVLDLEKKKKIGVRS